MIIDHLKSLYKIDISEDELDEIQREEPFVNFNYRQAELLRRTIALRKVCSPISKSQEQLQRKIKGRFHFSFADHYLNQAKGCLTHGFYLASIMLCRSALEISLREAIACVESSKSETTFLREYINLEKRSLRDLIPKAQELHLIDERELENTFIVHPRLRCDFKPRKLLDKFIHGGYSELFTLLRETTIQGKGKSKNIEEFIEKMQELDSMMNEQESLARHTYARMVLSEGLSLFFISAVLMIYSKLHQNICKAYDM